MGFAFTRFDIANCMRPYHCLVTQEQCKEGEKALDEQNEEMMSLVMERYHDMTRTMEEEKKAKLEQLYDQIVAFQENTDSAKEAMETTTKEMEETDDLAFLLVSVALLKLSRKRFSLNAHRFFFFFYVLQG